MTFGDPPPREGEGPVLAAIVMLVSIGLVLLGLIALAVWNAATL